MPSTEASAQRNSVSLLRQAWILTRRYVAIWRGDLMALGTMLGQALLVALLLGAVFGKLDDVANPIERAQRTVNLLFLVNVACFWFGCNNAAKEIVKERIIYARERDFNLRLDSYWVSKFAVLVLLALVQVVLLFAIVRFWCGPPGQLLGQWGALAALAALAVAGTALGLLVSAWAKTEEVAVALVPIAVMPQIILAGVIAPLSGFPQWIAEGAITVYWGAHALQALLPEADLTMLRMERFGYGSQVAVIGVQAILFAGLTLMVLWWQGRAKG